MSGVLNVDDNQQITHLLCKCPSFGEATEDISNGLKLCTVAHGYVSCCFRGGTFRSWGLSAPQ